MARLVTSRKPCYILQQLHGDKSQGCYTWIKSGLSAAHDVNKQFAGRGTAIFSPIPERLFFHLEVPEGIIWAYGDFDNQCRRNWHYTSYLQSCFRPDANLVT